jgi:hypothetical protein
MEKCLVKKGKMKTLIIDEVSMVSAEFFDLANVLLTFVRNYYQILTNFPKFVTIAYDNTNIARANPKALRFYGLVGKVTK